jgi:hypothetical protein
MGKLEFIFLPKKISSPLPLIYFNNLKKIKYTTHCVVKHCEDYVPLSCKREKNWA